MARVKKPARQRPIPSAVGEGLSAAAKVSALDVLQRSLGLTRTEVDAWVKRVRAERRSASARLVRSSA